MSLIPSLAIIGGGYSGLSIALHLLQNIDFPLRIHFLDRLEPTGRGVAYQPICREFLLNVPSGRMGALAGQPEGFLEWLRLKPGYEQTLPGAFVGRELYGQYLQTLLPALLAQHKSVEFLSKKCEVLDLHLTDFGVSLNLSDHTVLEVQWVVLALGNFPPANPPLETPEFYQEPSYFGNPWLPACLEDLDPQAPVLLLGTGLTMVDTVLGLRAKGHQGLIQVISPRGKLPWPVSQEQLQFPIKFESPTSLLELFRQIRKQMRGRKTQAEWQVLVNALRPLIPSIWQSLNLKERQRFLRHLRHPWGQMRHRLPREIYQELEVLLTQGSLEVIAGWPQRLAVVPEGVCLSYRPRGQDQLKELSGFQRVINCTGPNLDYTQIDTPLLKSLRAQGLILPDPLKLGLQVSEQGALLDQQGQSSEVLFTLGPALRGKYWEATAVPEIREQALCLAQVLTEKIKQVAAVSQV